MSRAPHTLPAGLPSPAPRSQHKPAAGLLSCRAAPSLKPGSLADLPGEEQPQAAAPSLHLTSGTFLPTVPTSFRWRHRDPGLLLCVILPHRTGQGFLPDGKGPIPQGPFPLYSGSGQQPAGLT